jgi:anti-sigma B factor antagonist
VQIELVEQDERVTVVAPRGRLDMASAPEFRESVKRLVESGSTHLVVDLHDVSFVDSSGLGAIVGGLKAARNMGGELRIARANQQVLLVLDLTSLNRVLTPYETVAEAAAGF